jgi:DNA-directed RNA polymerase specialized sigma subunit
MRESGKKYYDSLQQMMLQKRYQANMTQAMVARKLGIGFSTYQQSETTGVMSREIAEKVAKWIGVKI